MTIEILNLAQLRTHLSQQILQLQEEKLNEALSLEESRSLLSSLLTERKLFLDEVDSLKASQRSENFHFSDNSDSLLILSEIDQDVYNDFQNFSRKLRRTDGEILSNLMTLFLKYINDNGQYPDLSAKELVSMVKGLIPTIRVANHDYIRITNADLQELDVKVNFRNIDNLILDVNPTNFISRINSIRDCDIVQVPNSLPKLLVYLKINNCREIRFLPSIAMPALDYAKEANQLIDKWNN
ncbi:MAG: hypothetical protein KAT16_08425, partial [Candidatus Heimdallarchaeota archaeon]|nr:hypothetical protein [Candidatus Heimdallarchaeota archaeon]